MIVVFTWHVEIFPSLYFTSIGMQVKTVWSYLLQHFELELSGPFPEVDWNAMVVGIKGKVMVRYKRRQLKM